MKKRTVGAAMLMLGAAVWLLSAAGPAWGMYHPQTGRWLQRDPAGYPDGLHLYEYVRGEPTVLADHQGTSAAPAFFLTPCCIELRSQPLFGGLARHVSLTVRWPNSTSRGVNIHFSPQLFVPLVALYEANRPTWLERLLGLPEDMRILDYGRLIAVRWGEGDKLEASHTGAMFECMCIFLEAEAIDKAGYAYGGTVINSNWAIGEIARRCKLPFAAPSRAVGWNSGRVPEKYPLTFPGFTRLTPPVDAGTKPEVVGW